MPNSALNTAHLAILTDPLEHARSLLARALKSDGRISEDIDELQRSLHAVVARAESIESDRVSLLQQQAALRTVISSVPFFVFWKDRDCVYRGCNDIFASLGGLKRPEEIVGRTDYDMPWTKEQSDLYREDDLRVMRSGKPTLNIEETNVDANGNEKVILTSKVPLQAEDGSIIGMLGIFADISARKQMEKDLARAKEAAEDASRAKSDFLAAVSHELRTPLALVLGPLDTLLQRSDVSAEARVEIERIRRNALRLKGLMDDVLDFAKADAGKAAPHDEVLDPEHLVRSLVDDVRLAATARGLELSAQTDAVGLVTIDRRKCEKILLNLLGNALKFTPAGGKIVASLRADGDALVFAVEDTGIGIAPADRALLFQRFQQIDSSSTRRYEGTGLGLALVKQFAELMSGTVGVESEVGRGSRFFVRLPWRPCATGDVAASQQERLRADLATLNARFAQAPAPAAASEGLPASGADPGRPLLVLAEDNSDLRGYLTELLRPHYRVFACADGAAALAEATRQRPDLIVTDVMMPEMDGYELLARLKTDPNLNDVPVILLTALATQDAVASSLANGAVDFLNKPFSPTELLARLGVAARLSAARKKLTAKNRELEAAHARLAERNAAMRVVLDHVDQGLFTVDAGGRLAEEHSAITDRWFGPYVGQPLCSEFLGEDPQFATAFTCGLEALREGFLPRELCLDQLPKLITIGGRQFSCKFLPIGAGDKLDGLLAVINDVTHQLIAEKQGEQHRELLAVYTALMRDRAGFLGFFDETRANLRELDASSADERRSKRLLHTVKGNAAVMGLEAVARLCHQAEDDLDSDGSIGAATRADLTTLWTAIEHTTRAVSGDEGRHSVEVARREIEVLVEEIERGVDRSHLVARLKGWRCQPSEKPLARLAEYARRLAVRLHKDDVVVEVEDQGVRVDPEEWAPLWSNLVHMVRNAIDHGIESPDEREKSGKPRHGRLRLTTSRGGGGVVVDVHDDGRGIDWASISRLAAEKGLPCASEGDLLDVILRPDVSTRQVVTMTSGRGTGLAAVADTVRKLGGTISVESRAGMGTRWRLSLPNAEQLAL